MAKVFRKSFSVQKNSLPKLVPENSIPKGFLRELNNIDVTHEYVEVADLTFEPRVPLADSLTVAYLNVFNTGLWKAVDWAKKEGGKFTFTNVGVDLVYLPGLYRANVMRFDAFPILLDRQGKPNTLKPNFRDAFGATLSRDNEYGNVHSNENNPLVIEAGKDYRLLYWDHGWKRIGTARATPEGATFKNLPKNALFRLIGEKFTRYERVFTIDPETHRIRWF
jgi:hypothetical protein